MASTPESEPLLARNLALHLDNEHLQTRIGSLEQQRQQLQTEHKQLSERLKTLEADNPKRLKEQLQRVKQKAAETQKGQALLKQQNKTLRDQLKHQEATLARYKKLLAQQIQDDPDETVGYTDDEGRDWQYQLHFKAYTQEQDDRQRHYMVVECRLMDGGLMISGAFSADQTWYWSCFDGKKEHGDRLFIPEAVTTAAQKLYRVKAEYLHDSSMEAVGQAQVA